MDLKKRLEQSPAGKQWLQIGVKQHHGIALPLFSLHSKESCGIGEYPDLLPLIDWCHGLGMDLIQLLPLNDTGSDTSPYSALSAFALNPLHLGLSRLPSLNHSLKEQVRALQGLNGSQRVDYDKVRKGKERFFREYYQQEFKQVSRSAAYQDFLVQNRFWLFSYALYKVLKEKNGERSWESWDPFLRDPTENMVEELCQEFNEEVNRHIFIQYLSFNQLQEVKKQAEQRGMWIKGDVPILIGRDSADVWIHHSIFHLNYSAGAPPDMFNHEGQNWGFPIYNWKALERENYSWWQQRLAVAAHCYHLYRIDHILGFFRIWATPLGKSAREGRFIPENSEEWTSHGEAIMRMMLASCPMLPIGEDLGMVPSSVRDCLRNLGICGTKVMRWERVWEEDQRFIKSEDYIPESMTTVSTHDSETLQLWWKVRPEEAHAFAKFKGWSYQNELTAEQRQQILWDSHHTSSLFHINLLQEYFPLVSGLSWNKPEDERINVPGIISEKNWSYRFRPSVEELIAHGLLANSMHSIIAK